MLYINIVYFIEKLPYQDQHEVQGNYACGGSEFAASGLANAIANHGNNVTIVTTSKDTKNFTEFGKNIVTHRLGTYFKLFNRHICPGIFNKLGQINGDLIHVHVCTEPFFPLYALLCAKLNKKPLVLTCHVDAGMTRNFISFKYKLLSKMHGIIIDIIYHSADIIITPSEQFAKSSKILKKFVDKIITIPNGVDFEDLEVDYSKSLCRQKIGLSLDRTLLLFVGNPHPNKGLDILIKAMKRIEIECPNSDLIIIGDGAYKEDLKGLAAKLGIKNIYFKGYISDDFKKLYYCSADIFVLPSFFDVNPLVLLEASYFRLPLVVSDIPAFKDLVVNNYNGIVIKLGNDVDLAIKLIYLINHPKICERLGKNARCNVESLSWEWVARKTEQLYSSLIK